MSRRHGHPGPHPTRPRRTTRSTMSMAMERLTFWMYLLPYFNPTIWKTMLTATAWLMFKDAQ